MLVDSKLPTIFKTEAVSTACYVLNSVSITNPHNKTLYELLSGKVPNISHLKLFGCQVTILNTSDHLGKFEGKANEGFLVGYAANSTQDDDSESECDEQAILVPSFPSNSFSAEKYGFEFSNETTEMLHQAKIETRKNLVLATGDPASSIVSTGGVLAGSVLAGGIPTSSVPAGSIVSTGGVLAGSVLAGGIPTSSVPASSVPAGSVPASSVPAGGVLAGSVDSAGFGDLAASESVPAVFNPDHANNSTLPPGHSLGLSEHFIRFPYPSNLGNHQPKAGIFSSSSYDDDFCADRTTVPSTDKE
uniref:Retrovirus-related Pol polyprotein from transposon TNT 1-94 n=1 Tax=Tanacetum cinerariifolium TaxID=118510 RepID=A0A6L2N2J1_TANCI|nr:retrovirus-related Pol polyprotein from transposon TNT 1-94 [Tanacetum cinerariifolium]